MKESYYQVAGHLFRLSFHESIFQGNSLSNYFPFIAEGSSSGCIFHLSTVGILNRDGDHTLVGRFDDDIASIGIFKSVEGSFRFQIAYPWGGEYCTMDVDAGFRDARVMLPRDARLRIFCLNNCLMLLYAFSTAKLGTLMVHASVIKNGGDGFAFLGKSGTGKSTHSRLWLEHIEGSELLNDDNPVVRLMNNKPWVFGTPWSGKTPCHKNDGVALKGIAKLRQAPENKIKKLSLLQAYATIMSACSRMKWEEEQMTGIHRTVEGLVTDTACHRLDCLPDKAAAELCAATLRS